MLTQRKVVAIVEDDPDMRKGIVRLLNVYGFDTIAFPSAEAFLEEKTANEAICLVVDIHLSGMTGIELRRRMSASGSTLPVIFVTAVDDEATRVEALDTGCIAFLRKPFAASLLIGAIDKALH